jgi:hypothetical protein
MPLYLSQITKNGAIRIIRGGYRLVSPWQQRGGDRTPARSPDRDPEHIRIISACRAVSLARRRVIRGFRLKYWALRLRLRARARAK